MGVPGDYLKLHFSLPRRKKIEGKNLEKALTHPIDPDLNPKSSGDSKFNYERFAFKPAKIEKITVESPKVKSFYLKVNSLETPLPGQFLMVWLPGAEEVPMSVSDAGGGFIRISVSRKGPTTARFHELERGDHLYLRGPFGNGFSLKGRSHLLIGGGDGAFPLIYALKVLSNMGKRGLYAVGAKKGSELLFVGEARRLGKLYVATEDGSSGHPGLVSELLGELLAKEKFDSILTCGPERMMYEVVRRGLKEKIPVQASLERYMKCGFGVCGSCVLDPIGVCVCIDGPVFDGRLLLKTDFGKWKRDPSGVRVRV